MLSNYQISIADVYNIPIGNVKNFVPNFFDKEKYVHYYENLQLYFKVRIKAKRNISHIRIQQSQWLKIYVQFNTHKKIEADKTETKICTN